MSIPGPATNQCLWNGFNHMCTMSSLKNLTPLVTQLSAYFIITKLNSSKQQRS